MESPSPLISTSRGTYVTSFNVKLLPEQKGLWMGSVDRLSIEHTFVCHLQEALLSETEQRSKAEAAATQAELQQNSAYLQRVVSLRRIPRLIQGSLP